MLLIFTAISMQTSNLLLNTLYTVKSSYDNMTVNDEALSSQAIGTAFERISGISPQIVEHTFAQTTNGTLKSGWGRKEEEEMVFMGAYILVMEGSKAPLFYPKKIAWWVPFATKKHPYEK